MYAMNPETKKEKKRKGEEKKRKEVTSKFSHGEGDARE
jgi:hypothetical protein